MLNSQARELDPLAGAGHDPRVEASGEQEAIR
jgi:hypothetical protein